LCLDKNIDKAIEKLTNFYNKKKDTQILDELLFTLRRCGRFDEMDKLYNKLIVSNNKSNQMAYTCGIYFMLKYQFTEALK